MPRCANFGESAAEGPEERHVLRGVRKVVVAANDVRDPHIDVVDADGEVVERMPAGTDEDEVVRRARGKLDRGRG